MSAALITPPIADLLGATASLAAALRARLVSPERMRGFLAELAELAHPQPIELELAMVLAWLRRRDPAELGHVSFSGFYSERVDWGASWRKALVRLVESARGLGKPKAQTSARQRRRKPAWSRICRAAANRDLAGP